MAAIIAHQMPTSIRNRNIGRKQCTCCPYGYHIDLDFVRYCESVSNRQLEPRNTNGSERRPGRKKRASMEVLLGIPTPVQPRAELMCSDEGEALASAQVGDALQRAVIDFEETLERSTRPLVLPPVCWSSGKETDMKGEWLSERKNADWKRPYRRGSTEDKVLQNVKEVLTDREEKQELTQRDSDEASVASNNSNMSAGTLQNIREQMAASLERMRELEEQVKLIPVLQAQLSSLKVEKKDLDVKLRLKEKEIFEMQQLKLNESTIADSRDAINKSKRSIGVVANVMTRDVGVNNNSPLVVTVATQTRHENYPTGKYKDTLSLKDIVNPSSSSTRTVEANTDLKMDQIYCQEDLNRNIDKAIKLYEKTFHRLLHPKKAASCNIETQTDRVSKESKESAVQVKPEVRNFSAEVRPATTEAFSQAKVFSREIGVSDHTIKEVCAKCAIKKISIATNFPEGNRYVSLRSLGSRSKSFDYSESKTKNRKSVACGHDMSVSICKSTDTSVLNQKRDVGVSTMKRKLVDASNDGFQFPCQKCSESTRVTKGSVSRIPRPTTLTVPSQPRMCYRRNTYDVISPPDSRLQNEDYGSDSGSEDGIYYTRESSFNRNLDTAPIFQPILAERHNKTEPSKEMKAAMKVLNDSLQKSPDGNVQSQVKNARDIIQQEWFKISSTSSANPLNVEDYLDCFEDISADLLAYIVNMTDVTGNTAMHYAVSHGNFDVVSILLDSKVCNINWPNAAGYTCIMLVSLAQVRCETHRQVIRRLFHMADVNVRAKQHGQTALMLAVSHGRIDTVELLLESGADINIQDEDGSTALMCAAEHGHIEIVKLLLAQPDCDVTITDYDGSTALNIAMDAGNRDIGVLLYAQEHFSRGGSPHASKYRRAKSVTPTLRTPPPKIPSSPHSSKVRQSDHSV